MKYSEEYLNDLIEILELMTNIETRLLAYDLTNKFISNYSINTDVEIMDFLITKSLSLKFDRKKPISIVVDMQHHLVFTNSPEYDNRQTVIKTLNSVLNLKKKWYKTH